VSQAKPLPHAKRVGADALAGGGPRQVYEFEQRVDPAPRHLEDLRGQGESLPTGTPGVQRRSVQ